MFKIFFSSTAVAVVEKVAAVVQEDI